MHEKTVSDRCNNSNNRAVKAGILSVSFGIPGVNIKAAGNMGPVKQR
ncbi:MAG: hypothetical protein LLG37_05290 [Spirochaetia bacterium]|nr:hypothetical protein [Spirochaetia bacterium]